VNLLKSVELLEVEIFRFRPLVLSILGGGAFHVLNIFGVGFHLFASDTTLDYSSFVVSNQLRGLDFQYARPFFLRFWAGFLAKRHHVLSTTLFLYQCLHSESDALGYPLFKE